ncbi:sigma-E factor negative regulatory protein [Rhodoferax saidenbachensis]|uniref:Sigma-E factor negative regulatory protein RseA n=1 Tax=Rhodoferax saidenbachensis TaxID=1484693 RepID=A0ABU1ZLJ1_9BURK|nr:sigma-E factor negative regulatory protein [Rhodoferax saidenbachensis]MDR7306420.1 sigma-E factor negative regulatory protein RseA [Rhodoferax saidenbachensis]
MNTPNTPLNERISALADGAVPLDQLPELLAELHASEEGRQAWHLYHLTGDVLRSDALAPSVSELAFWERLQSRLDTEPVRPAQALTQPEVVLSSAGSANQRWAWVAGLAGVAMLSVLSLAVWRQAEPTNAPQLALVPAPSQAAPAEAAPPVVLAQDSPAVMLRDPQLDALMAAHQQMGGHSAWQMPSGFLRNATFERPAR